MVGTKKSWAVLAIIFFLFAFGGCSKEKPAERSDLPDLTKQSRPFVTVEQTKVHTGPGFQHKTIATIPRGTKIDIVGRHDDWLLVTSKRGNAPGYIEAAAARPASDNYPSSDNYKTSDNNNRWEPVRASVAGPYKLLANTEVREGPGLHYRTVAKVPKGIKVNVTGEEDGWLRVESRHGKPPGYVDRNLAEPFRDR
jgi:uncharacterized protein YgiM (DUF1202 family)